MTARVGTLTVCLDKEYRDDDVEVIVNALRMVRGVADVKIGTVMDAADYMARQTVLTDYLQLQHELMWHSRDNDDVFKQIRQLLLRK